jgi:hypothetical protein
MLRKLRLERLHLAAALVLLCIGCGLPFSASAHGIAEKDAAFVAQSAGAHIVPFLYLGAKHMVTGYDHLLFLFGVVFFLYRLKDVVAYVTLFSLGHSTTLLMGVLGGIHVNAYLVDAVIGLSVVYIVFDNLSAEHETGGARVWSRPWVRPCDQSAGAESARRGLSDKHHFVQCWR